MKNRKYFGSDHGNRGLIGIIIMIVIALVLLKYFLNWNIFEAAATPKGQETVGYTQSIIQVIWSHLAVPFHFIWDRVLYPLLMIFWNTLQDFIIFSKKAATAK